MSITGQWIRLVGTGASIDIFRLEFVATFVKGKHMANPAWVLHSIGRLWKVGTARDTH